MKEQYVKLAVTNIEEGLARIGKILPSKCVPPILSNYAPWLEDSPKMMEGGVQRYEKIIGQIRWDIDIRLLDILLETLLLLRYLTMT